MFPNFISCIIRKRKCFIQAVRLRSSSVPKRIPLEMHVQYTSWRPSLLPACHHHLSWGMRLGRGFSDASETDAFSCWVTHDRPRNASVALGMGRLCSQSCHLPHRCDWDDTEPGGVSERLIWGTGAEGRVGLNHDKLLIVDYSYLQNDYFTWFSLMPSPPMAGGKRCLGLGLAAIMILPILPSFFMSSWAVWEYDFGISKEPRTFSFFCLFY